MITKANNHLQTKEEQERLLNTINSAVRRSLNPDDIMQVAVEQLGQGLGICRCVIYRCGQEDVAVEIHHEFIN